MYVDLCYPLFFRDLRLRAFTFTNTSDTAENAMTLWRPLYNWSVSISKGFGLEMGTVNQHYQAKIGELGINCKAGS
jgi:hypothetical protein